MREDLVSRSPRENNAGRRRLLVLAITLAVSSSLAALATTFVGPARAAELQVEQFDQLWPELQSSQDENIPDDVLGWTHTPPRDWSVEVAPEMPQGVTEWQGWSFTTMNFWTAADTQGREDFTRAKDIIAVADPDEWDDKGSPSSSGNFDSTLVSKPFELPQQDKVYLSFVTHYQHYDEMTAQVLVSFDGGSDREVLRYDGQATSDNAGGDVLDEYVLRAVDVPEGAQEMVVKWRLSNAGNDWFWAIDDVRVDPEDPTPNRPPVARDDTAETTQNRQITVNVLRNDRDPDQDDLKVTKVTEVLNGEVKRDEGGKLVYTPRHDFVGRDRFVYAISDGRGGKDTATVIVKVRRPGD